MAVAIEDMDLNAFMDATIGRGKMVLVRYGPGSGGELFLKEFVTATPPGENRVLISTYESGKAIASEQAMGSEVTILSLMEEIRGDVETTARRDRFLTNGILVTDLFEISMQDDIYKRHPPGIRILSMITDTALKQVLPFRMSIDSVSDLVWATSKDDVLDRLKVLRGILDKVNGMILIGAPAGWSDFGYQEHYVFDAILETRCTRIGSAWERTITLAHLRNGRNPPRSWKIEY